MAELFAKGGGAEATVSDLLLWTKIAQGRALLEEILLRKIAARRAASHGVTVDDDDLDAALSEFWSNLELFEPEKIQNALHDLKLDEEAIRDFLREKLLKERLAPLLVTDEVVRQRFQASPYDYVVLHVQKIVLGSRGACAETLLQLNESEIAWELAARRAGGMTTDQFYRKDAPGEASAELFAAPVGAYVGPVEESATEYAIYRLAFRVEPLLDDELREEIRQEIFNEELRAVLAAAPPVFLS